jgi:hypothetical protein
LHNLRRVAGSCIDRLDRTEFFISPHHIAACVTHSWIFIVQTHERIYESSRARSLHLEILLGTSAVISPRRVCAGSLTFG